MIAKRHPVSAIIAAGAKAPALHTSGAPASIDFISDYLAPGFDRLRSRLAIIYGEDDGHLHAGVDLALHDALFLHGLLDLVPDLALARLVLVMMSDSCVCLQVCCVCLFVCLQSPGLFDGCRFYFHGEFHHPIPPREYLIRLVCHGDGVLTHEPRREVIEHSQTVHITSYGVS